MPFGKNCEITRSTRPKLESPHAKWAAKPPIFGALFSSFGGVDSRYLMVFLEDFARESLIVSDDNIASYPWNPIQRVHYMRKPRAL